MKWWKITNQSDNNAEILLYGTIGDGWASDNQSKDLADTLQGLRHMSNLTLRINSPGGEVSAAQAVYNIIKSHPAYITVIIDGIAASASSLIAMAGDKIIMPVNALLMIHDPMAYVSGDGGDMLHAAAVLEKFKDTMIAVYSSKTGKDADELSQMMDAETWFSAEEALSEGFVDEIDADNRVNFFAENNGGAFKINGLSVSIKSFKNIPAAIVTTVNKKPLNGMEGEIKIMNAEQVKAEYPDVYNQICNAGITSERERIKGIDSIRANGYEEIKNEAKYETFAQAGAVAIEIVNAQAGKVAGAAAGLAEDVNASGVNNIPVGNAPALEPSAEETAAKALVQKAIEAANKNIDGR